MLKPIPKKIMRSTATVNVCTGTDRYQNQQYTAHIVKHVHLQPTNEIRKTQDNTDCTLRAILFVDARVSTPFLDWCALLRGTEYTVMGVDELRDDTDELHHWEVSLV